MRLLIKLAYLPFIIGFWPFYYFPLSVSFVLIIAPERGAIWFVLLPAFIAELIAAKMAHRAVTAEKIYFFIYSLSLGSGTALAASSVPGLGGYSPDAIFAASSLIAMLAGRMAPIAFFRFRNQEHAANLKSLAKFGTQVGTHSAFLKLESGRIPCAYLFVSLIISGALVLISVFIPVFSQNGFLLGDFVLKATFSVFPLLAFFMLGAHCFYIYHPDALWKDAPEAQQQA